MANNTDGKRITMPRIHNTIEDAKVEAFIREHNTLHDIESFFRSLKLLPDPFAQIEMLRDKIAHVPMIDLRLWVHHPRYLDWLRDHASDFQAYLDSYIAAERTGEWRREHSQG